MKPEGYRLTGHRGIKRKPVPDHGKSLKNLYSGQTGEASFLEAPHSSGLVPTQTSPGSQVGEDMDVDQSSEIAPESSMFFPCKIVPRFAEHILTIPALPSYTPKNPRSRLLEQNSYLGDLDALPSSSPQGQSTPRLRREPLFEDGMNTLTKVHADSRSFLDSHPDSSHGVHSSEMDIDVQQIGVAVSTEEDTPKRKMSQKVASPSKRSKKHPSPPRDLLAQMALQVMNSGEDKEVSVVNSVAGGALSSKNTNEKVKAGKGHMPGKVVFARQELPRTAGSMPNLGAAKSLKSAMRKPATETRDYRRQHSQDFSQNNIRDESMDVDELQWDKTHYIIGGRNP